MSEGIDVSKHQGVVDWKQVYAAGKRFAFARASVASFTKDETFVQNYKGMVAAGLVPGAYHLVSGESTGAQQANNFKAQLGAAGFQKGMLALDVEGWTETVATPVGTLKATEYLCNWIRDTYGRTPIIYTGVYWRENLQQHSDNFGAELWLSYYGTNEPTNYVPAAWKDKGWKILQYTSTGTVAGVTGNVDLNKNAGTLKSLKELAGWEWDELATQAEIRTIVADEVSKVTAALQATQSQLLVDITGSTKAELAQARLDTLARLDEIKAMLNAPNNTSIGIAEILTEVDKLHAHICRRVDLHQTGGI